MTPDDGFRMLDDDDSWPLALERREVPSRRLVAPAVARVTVAALVVAVCGGVVWGALALRDARGGGITPIGLPSACSSASTSPSPAPSASHPVSDDPDDPDDPGFVDQSEVNHLANLFTRAAHALNVKGQPPVDRGFTSVRLEGGTGVTLVWKGPVPADVQQIIDEAPANITVTVDTSAPYSSIELSRGQSRLVSQWQQIAREGIPLSLVSADHDGRGLRVGVDVDDDTSAAQLEAMRDKLADIAGVPIVSIEQQSGILADIAPADGVLVGTASPTPSPTC